VICNPAWVGDAKGKSFFSFFRQNADPGSRFPISVFLFWFRLGFGFGCGGFGFGCGGFGFGSE